VNFCFSKKYRQYQFLMFQFLIEDLLDERSMKDAALERAAQITPLITSITIGPNSSYRSFTSDEEEVSENPSENSPIKIENPRRSITIKTSRITSSDLKAMQLKLYQESEDRKMREKVRKQMEDRIVKERDHYKQIQQKLEAMKLDAEEKHREKIQDLEKNIATALKLEEQEEMKYQNHRAELTKNARKVIEQQEKDLRDNLKRIEDKLNKLESTFNQLAQACNQENLPVIDLYRKHFDALKEVKNANKSSLDGLKSACIKAEELCHGLVIANAEFEENAKAQIAKKEAEAQKAAVEAENAARQIAQTHKQTAPEAVPVAPRTTSETGRRYSELMQILNEKQNATRRLTETRELEGIRFALKLAVNTPINHLNEQNRSTLVEGFQKLQSLLSGVPITTTKGVVKITDHPEASDWTKLRIAEKLIDVSDKKPDTIFYIAAVTVALWQEFPDFGLLFLAQLFKECPFLVPYKPGQLQGQSDVDFLKSWGYRVTEQAEKYEHYQSRTSNFATLIAAIWITFSRRGVQAPHPFGIDNGWKYMVNIISSQPDPMYLHFIDKVLEVAGSTMHMTFGRQFVKVVMIVRDVYLPSVERNVDASMKGAFDRLRDITIAKFFRESQFPTPKKKLNANFW
jgi:nucleoporin GLE1